MKKIIVVIGAVLCLNCLPASAQLGQRKPCEELKAEITAKLDAKGVKGYTLEILPAEEVKDQKVVGSCDGGTKRITYKRD